MSEENASFTLNTQDRHAVAYDARNSRLNVVTVERNAPGEESGGWSLNYINPVIQPDVPCPAGMDHCAACCRWSAGGCRAFQMAGSEITPLTDAEETRFWREVYLRNCKIKGQKPRKSSPGQMEPEAMPQ